MKRVIMLGLMYICTIILVLGGMYLLTETMEVLARVAFGV